MYCSKCGTQNQDNVAFCGVCGNPMEVSTQKTLMSTLQVQPTIQNQVPVQPTDGYNNINSDNQIITNSTSVPNPSINGSNNRKSNKKTLIIAGIVIGVLLVLSILGSTIGNALGVFSVMKGKYLNINIVIQNR